MKVKVKSLAAEAGVIRLEERRARKNPRLRAELWAHRTGVVRTEARLSLLAYAFLRGRPYRASEPKSDPRKVDWKRVEEMVKRFGVTGFGTRGFGDLGYNPALKDEQAARFKEWREAANG